jgi:precorrin-6B methylase 2
MRKETSPSVGLEASHAVARSLYGWRAASYELQLVPYEFIRCIAVEHLQLRPGECVLDLGSGTGMSLPLLYEAVGPAGRIVAVDQCPEMLDIARSRVQHEGWGNVELLCAAVEDALLPRHCDAALLHFTHDILQSPKALDYVLKHLQPGARLVATGLKWTAPGLVPCNLMVGLHMAQSVTNYEGLNAPWQLLLDRIGHMDVDSLMMGTVFVARGMFVGKSLQRRSGETH